MKVSAQYAVEHFDDLAVAVDDGEVVEIERADKPALQLVRSAVEEPFKPGQKRVLGAGKAFAKLPSEEELERIDREWKQELEERRVFPGERA